MESPTTYRFVLVFTSSRGYTTKVVRGTKGDLQHELDHLFAQGDRDFSLVKAEVLS